MDSVQGALAWAAGGAPGCTLHDSASPYEARGYNIRLVAEPGPRPAWAS